MGFIYCRRYQYMVDDRVKTFEFLMNPFIKSARIIAKVNKKEKNRRTINTIYNSKIACIETENPIE